MFIYLYPLNIMYLHHIRKYILCLYIHSTLMRLKVKVICLPQHQPENNWGMRGPGAAGGCWPAKVLSPKAAHPAGFHVTPWRAAL